MDVTRACELCEAARFTEWYYEDDQCWVAECEACCVPMIVWKKHDPHPDDATKAKLHSRLLSVATSVFDYEPYIDDNMRNIPDHYHAHARGRGLGFGQTPKRRDLSH
ncbi:MAG: hypothetical protein F2909_01240 [Actinobacteria bacterium]|nr:hypothetical protein [Actinomycetota bacterium]MSX14884.1 hypothetical protein [Actinomycetota bacterium]MSX35866.1 hypothetical protein [Actinomycetota bacterium]MSZ70952.1 hypothetical protein [Actinomycetota bacterium]MUH55594.1 hypothetical protein [Actinomycetota bacterium]